MAPRKTVLEIVQSTTGYLKKYEIESARLNAEHLVAHVLKIKRIQLYTDFERELYEDELAPLRELVRRRSQGVPLQHLLGSEEFFGRTFLSDARALIPRPETERLIEFLLPLLKGSSSRIADVGTGTGIIAITLAAELPDCEVIAIDISPDALALAQENADRLLVAATPPSLPSQIKFTKSDLLSEVPGAFDCIVANLPYIPTAEIPALSREVQHDPVSALDGGPDGLNLIRRLITQSAAQLNPGGNLALEVGHDQAERVGDLLTAANFRDIRIEKDYQGVSRFLFAKYG